MAEKYHKQIADWESKGYQVVFLDDSSKVRGTRIRTKSMGVFYGADRVWRSQVLLTQEQTNNRAELLAAIHALCIRDPTRTTVLVTDCEYLVKGYNTHMPGWHRHD